MQILLKPYNSIPSVWLCRYAIAHCLSIVRGLV